jgi:uncharacterized repeat protein (TIGR01451 family)
MQFIHSLASAIRRYGIAMFAALMLLACGPALAADFYVSPSGDDSNICTSSVTPCKTIQGAIDQASVDDTVHVGPGNYPFSNKRIVIDKPGLKLVGDNSPFDASSTPGAPVKAGAASVLQAASAGVSGGGTNGMIWVKNVPNVEVRNLYIELSGFFIWTNAKEAVVATGAVEGLVVDNNFIMGGGFWNGSNIGISVNLAAGEDSSVPSSEPRSPGQYVTISNNAIVPNLSGPAVCKRGIAMENSVGAISGNRMAATTEDMWIEHPDGGGSQRALTISGNWYFGKLQLYLSSGSNLDSTLIDGNHFDATQAGSYTLGLGNGSEAHSLRVMGANGGSPTTISNNEFTGFGGTYRALWVMGRPNVTIEGNTFTPAANQSDFTEIVVGNREVWNGLPAPNPYDVVIRANTFNANGAPANNKGKAILFVDDNDADGAAGFTRAIVGGHSPADANSFDAGIRWFIALDDRSCDGQNHNGSGSCKGTSSYDIGQGIAYSGGSDQSSQKRPFKWDVDAVGNTFGGVYMPDMTQGEYDDVWAKTYDRHDAATDPGVGNVIYGYPRIGTGTVTFSPSSFTYDGNAHTITAALNEDAKATCTVTPATVTNAGDTTVSATCTSAAYVVTGSGTVHVAKATGTVAWGDLDFTYDGSAHAITANMQEDGAATCTVNPASVTEAGDTPVHADCEGANYIASADETAHVAKAAGTVDWGTLDFTYDGNSPVVTATLDEEGTTCTVTGTVGPDAGNYPVHAECNGANHTASDDATAHIAKATGTVTWGQLDFTYGSTSPTVTATLDEEGTACTVTGTVGPDAGDYDVHAECNGANHTASDDATAHIAKATGAVTWGSLSFTYDATAHAITASMQEDGAATCTVNPASVTEAGNTSVHADCSGTNYTASANETAHVAKAGQAITGFAADPANPVYSVDGTFTVSATGGASGNDVTFGSTTPEVCTVAAGGTVSILSAGVCALTADQAGNDNYEAADPVTLDVVIGQASATLALSDLSQTFDNTPKHATVTVDPAGVAYSVTYDGSATEPTNAGSYAVVAHITDPNYSGSDATGTLEIAKASQAITNFVADPANPTYSPNGTFAVSATGGASGNDVTFGSTTPSVCTVSGNTVTMLSAGDCELTADQAGNDNYEAAPQVTLDVDIAEAPAPDLAISIDDGRDYVQYGKPLTYTIIVSNVGNTDVSGATVASVLPATLTDGSWTCVASQGSACGSASGSGGLDDTGVSIAQGGSVIYAFDATVNDDPAVGTDEIVLSAKVTAPGDDNTANDEASDTTTSVLFRDGFEEGGDGAQPITTSMGGATSGAMDASSVQQLDLATAAGNGLHDLARVSDVAGDAMDVQLLRAGDAMFVRLAGISDGQVRFGEWSRVPVGTPALAIGMAEAGGQRTLLLVGAEQALEAPLAHAAGALHVIAGSSTNR